MTEARSDASRRWAASRKMIVMIRERQREKGRITRQVRCSPGSVLGLLMGADLVRPWLCSGCIRWDTFWWAIGISGERGKQHIKALPRFGYKCASRIDHKFHPYMRRAPANGALVRNRRWRRWPAWEASCRGPPRAKAMSQSPWPRPSHCPSRGLPARCRGFFFFNWERAPPSHLDSSSTSLPSGLGCVLINVPLKGLVRNHPLTGDIADIMESTRLTRSGPLGSPAAGLQTAGDTHSGDPRHGQYNWSDGRQAQLT